MKKRKTTLRKSIILNNLIAILIPIILFGLFSVQVYISNYAEATASKNKIIADTLRDQFTTILHEPLNLLTLTEEELLDINPYSVDHMNVYLNNIVVNYDYVINIEVIDDTGKVVYSGINQDQNIGAIRTGEAFYTFFRENEQSTFWSSPYISPSTEELTLHISKMDKKGYFITVYINLQTLSRTSLEFTKSFNENLDIAVTDHHGIYISHSDITNVYKRLFEPQFKRIRALTDSNDTYAIIDYSDQRYVVSSSVMDQTEWYVIIYQPFMKTFSFVYQLAILLFLVILIAVTIAMVYAVTYARRVDVFIKSMNSEIDTALANDYKVSLPEFEFEDFNNIGYNFNQLMYEIGERDDKLFDMAYNDALTGIGNRTNLLEYISNSINTNPDMSFTFIHIDIDNFKIINDLYGHETGDKLILYIAKTLLKYFSGPGISINRIGGDEFGIIAEGILTEENYYQKIYPLAETLKDGILMDKRIIRTSISAGMVHYPNHTSEMKALLQYADIALLEAKNDKKMELKLYSPEMREKIQFKSSMDTMLRAAISEDLFELHFQPQINTETEEVMGFEALVRMRNKKGELISPFHFIPIAEESGLILDLGEWIIAEAINRLLEINKLMNKDYHIAINISTVQMQSPNFVNHILELINTTGVNKALIEFEITESVFIHNYDDAKTAMTALSNENIRFSLDDFGTGYSSLSYLSNLPFDILKIDRSFIADVENDAHKHNLLESVITLGHKLDLNIVAEGIESMDQMAIVKDLHCDSIQGYLYSRPLPFDQLIKYLKQKEQA